MVNSRQTTLGYWAPEQLLHDRFFYLSTISMRKGCDREKKNEKIKLEIMTFKVATKLLPVDH